MKLKKMTFILFIIFLAFFILFLIPFGVGIINIGNITGLIVCGFSGLVCLFWDRFKELIHHLCESTGGKAAVVISGGLLAACVLTALVISGFMIKEMTDKPKSETTLVVLGCQVRGSAPSLMLQRRLNAAYDYLVGHEEVKVIVSGGQGEDEEISEALCMYNYLKQKGISAERIYMEDKSINTSENIEFSKRIIESRNLCSDITIVTDGFHQYRADNFAKQHGLRAYNLVAKTPLWLLPTYWIRELYGIIYYTIF